MTTEERFERIEHLTAGLAEERRKDREEYKALWRDTQRQLNELSTRVLQIADAQAEADKRIEAEVKRATAAEEELRRRIADLVSAIGQFLSQPR